MSAMAKPLPGANMDETAIYQANDLSGSGPDQPTENSDMPNSNPTPTPQAQGRYTFSSGARPLDGYTIKRAIGRGGFGEVYYATSDSGKEVALKLRRPGTPQEADRRPRPVRRLQDQDGAAAPWR